VPAKSRHKNAGAERLSRVGRHRSESEDADHQGVTRSSTVIIVIGEYCMFRLLRCLQGS